jgi:hypothetical protein
MQQEARKPRRVLRELLLLLLLGFWAGAWTYLHRIVLAHHSLYGKLHVPISIGCSSCSVVLLCCWWCSVLLLLHPGRQG